VPDPNDDSSIPMLTDVLVPGNTAHEHHEIKKTATPSAEAAPDDASIPMLTDVLAPGGAQRATGEPPEEYAAAGSSAASPAGASARRSTAAPSVPSTGAAPVPAAPHDDDAFPVLTDVVSPSPGERARTAPLADASRGEPPAHGSEASLTPAAAIPAEVPAPENGPFMPEAEAGTSHGVATAPLTSSLAQPHADDKSQQAAEAGTSHAVAAAPPTSSLAQPHADDKSQQAAEADTHPQHPTRRSHHAKPHAQPEAHGDDEGAHHDDTRAHHRAKSHRTTAHAKSHHADDAHPHGDGSTALDADLIAEKLRGRFANYLTGDGRHVIETRCRDVLREHTSWLVSQITREVALALEMEMTRWVREAVREEIAHRKSPH
jgi:hypothetical protein